MVMPCQSIPESRRIRKLFVDFTTGAESPVGGDYAARGCTCHPTPYLANQWDAHQNVPSGWTKIRELSCNKSETLAISTALRRVTRFLEGSEPVDEKADFALFVQSRLAAIATMLAQGFRGLRVTTP
jgi:hypothetical protein